MSRLWHTSTLFFANTSFVWAPHPPPLSPALLHNILFPPDPLYCNIHHTILVTAVSCEGHLPSLGLTRASVENAERGNEYGILCIFILFCEYIHFYVRVHVIHRVNQAGYVIHILVVARQEYVNICSTRTRPSFVRRQPEGCDSDKLN